jgi:uncharacterized protein with PIN domain
VIVDSSAIVAILLREPLRDALARLRRGPLLFTGHDFTHTDLISALPA